jgi:hypothetical protein
MSWRKDCAPCFARKTDPETANLHSASFDRDRVHSNAEAGETVPRVSPGLPVTVLLISFVKVANSIKDLQLIIRMPNSVFGIDEH